MTEERDYLEEATQLMAAKELELVAKGFPDVLASRAVERARGTALYKSTDIKPEIRQQAFRDILEAELTNAEIWAAREKAFFDSQE